ncbi:unnamed protein product [Urochloa humidicola]
MAATQQKQRGRLHRQASDGRTAAARQAGHMAESRKDEDRPLLFVSRRDLGLWASKELAAKDQVIVKKGLKSGVQKRIFDNGESSGCAPSYFTAN